MTKHLKDLKALELDRYVKVHTAAGDLAGYIAEAEQPADVLCLFNYQTASMAGWKGERVIRQTYTHVPFAAIVAWTDCRKGDGTPDVLNMPANA